MKRILLASVLMAGALFLALGTTNSTSVQAADNACGDLPDSGPNFNFQAACYVQSDCLYEANSPVDEASCNYQFLRDMMSSCVGNPPTPPQRGSSLGVEPLLPKYPYWVVLPCFKVANEYHRLALIETLLRSIRRPV